MTSRPHIDDAERRTRLMRRHRLAAENPAGGVVDAADAIVGLHATTPSTVYLSAWARIPDFDPDDMTAALYTDRVLVKQLAMRRTLFVFSRSTLADAIGAVGPRVTASERTNMLRDLRRSDSPDGPDHYDDPDGWIDKARAAVLDELGTEPALTSTQLRERRSELDGYIVHGAGTKWAGRAPMGPRVLNMMSAAGEIVRGPNAAGWHLSRPSWVLMSRWLGAPLEPVDPAQGHRAMIDRWLRAFGPGTETDLVWWLGSTKTAVRAALADLDVVTVDLDGGRVGYVHADDLDPDHPVEPCALLLPELDPTTMGHKKRDFYVGDHAAHVFDTNGNGGQTAWWDGRIVGGWSQNPDGAVEVHLLEKLPAHARRALRERADELATWLGEVRPKPGYPAPFMRKR
ncbi:winged helix DNA-binding domain-containing protein [Gordonia sp. ABSL49_1]|nr:winged helix DNA-binding domain-containing protein [Gordonia sp. ABSL49_1]MCH5645250.1 winged helix DNA-binding domain-containing protein [Gordonia sp. ABSL49_1]